MKKLRIRFDMEKQREINQDLTERLETLSRKVHSNDYQNHSISQKFLMFDERIRRLEGFSIEANKTGQSKIVKVKEISKKFASTTTFYGVTRSIKAESSYMKIIWATMTLLSLGCGLYVIGNTIIDFLKYDVFTQTKRITTDRAVLPSVTFCSDTTDFNALFQEAQFIDTDGRVSLTGVDFFEGIEYNELNQYHCRKFNNYRNGSRDLFSVVDINHDIFFFNINLNVSYTYIDVFLSDNYLNVLTWSQFVTGFGNVKGEIYIDFTKSTEIKLPEPYNDCQIIGDETYRQANCIAQCKNNKAIANYNCSFKSYYSIPGYAFCGQSISEFQSGCEAQCPLECISNKFDAIISDSSSSSDPNDSLKFHIAYTDLSYISIAQTRRKMNGFTVMSNVGGALGLFIGIRFLSLVELLEYLTEIFSVIYP